MPLAFRRYCLLAILIVCFLGGGAERETEIIFAGVGESLEDRVAKWQASLSKKVIDLADNAPPEMHQHLSQVQSNIARVWEKQDKPTDLAGLQEALDAIGADFIGGADTFANGMKKDDTILISTGVLNMGKSVFEHIGQIANWIPVVGHILSIISSIMEFVIMLCSPKDQWQTSITSVMRRVIQYELDHNHISNLQEEYFSTYHEIQRIHEIFVAIKVNNDAQAAMVLDVSNFKTLTSKLNEFIGKLQYQIQTRLKTKNGKHLPTLFDMYWQSMVHYSMIQQRAVAFITSSTTPETDFSEIQIKYFVYVMNFQAQRDSAKQFFELNWKLLDELANLAIVGEPTRPVREFHLQLKPAGGDPGKLYVGMTPIDHGYPFAALSSTPAPLEIQWLDDSKWMTKSTINEGEWISIINPWSKADRKDRTVLYFGADGNCVKYMSPQEAGGSGKDQKESKARFKFQRKSRPSKEPLRDGDEVIVWNSHYDNDLLCGASHAKNTPEKYTSNSFHLLHIHYDHCRRNTFIIRITGDSDIKKLALLWQTLNKALTSGD